MSQTLYRKYRPQIFADVIGQNHIKITLQNEIISEQVAHAYLFTGPRGIGKTSLARILAKSLNCETKKEKETEPCNTCHSCVAITQGNSFDIIEIDAATHTQVDKVRDNIIENINFPPHGKYKVFIIDEVHMLSTAAFNALLKTLEEPPTFVVFILCTTEAYKLPETIISRCQRFDFKKVSAELITGKLKKIVAEEKLNIHNNVLATIALRSGGFIRDAESLLGQITSIITPDKKEITLADVEAIIPRSDFLALANLAAALIDKNAKAGLETINQLVADGVDLERFNLDALDYFRKMILIKLGLKNQSENIAGLSEEVVNKLIEQAEKIEINFLIKILDKLISIQNALKDAEIPQLPLEIAVVELCEEEKEIEKQKNKEIKGNEENKVNAETQNKNEDIEVGSRLHLEPTCSKENTSISKNITLEQIKSAWQEIIKASQNVNHSLPLILKASYPLTITNNLLEIGSEFDIHIQKLKSNTCLNNAEQIFSQVLNSFVRLKPITFSHEKAEELKQEFNLSAPELPPADIEEIAKSFGGKVIE
ncbi:hypothetical protein COX27_02050 [Candidatus Kuenenbacteria bacterium CG23_combo_of_CG06-09_8_20_14_all_36_9]|uniref:DNA polymerase III subunit gamma/tau n=1 Tax=Candidatus Kuenenbacteria bacterium CG10_big_fil_rev_8_21_14_0_10_36_11 TaxID=1974618 RepID=A0A2M6WAE7_9BACT|nr:MAG: hypothetical protein COX27_02050 [Candidatus Kuenenbacteria bacterium CG23_combo_of_CG06-09_8_20_14_all_36_9]PIT89747.1 MAG: hypothetical protein COU23_02225 [Candidatus Kuenenbacteria bacterium CG10_big_fil_rev_8_21_14_0_10_36_11]